MTFHSLTFLVFLITFLVIYWRLSGTSRLIFCLGGSYFFYGWWDYRFLSMIVLSTLVDYGVGIGLARHDENEPRRSYRKLLLLISLIVNLGVLATFKYFDFFAASLQQLTNSIGWELDWPTLHLVLPVGISFYTFQTLSYSIDVYRGSIPTERSLLKFATFVAFFPQLVAGPIVRASNFLPQLQQDRRWSFDNFERGFGLMLLGFFKKLVIADNIALLVDHLYGNPEAYTAVNTLIVLILYAFQIYGDFSGYSDLAIGIALILGFIIPVNFRFPYFADSFSDFWRRWHISLSSWLRDYLYIPLGGNRGGTLATYRNLMITMLLGGLWHGANWTFLIWGAIHGGLLISQRVFQSGIQLLWLPAFLRRVVQTGLVFALVCFAWVAFRSPSLEHCGRVLSPLSGLDGLSPSSLRDRIPLVMACFLVTLFVFCEWFCFCGQWKFVVTRFPVAKGLGYAAIAWMIALFGSFGSDAFIYFQF